MEEEISLKEIFNLLKENMGLIIRFILIAVLLAAVVTIGFIDATYESSTEMLVNQSTESETLNTNQIQTSVQLINTYSEIITSDTLLNEAQENMTQQPYTVGELREMVSVTSNADSQIFSIGITSEDPYFSAEFANTLAETFSDNIVDIFDVDNVSVISTAKMNENPVSPNLPLNIIIAAILGVGLAVLVIFIREAMDTTVRGEDFLQENGLLVLGAIYQLSDHEVKDSRFHMSAAPRNNASYIEEDDEPLQRRSRTQRDSSKRI